MLVCDRAIRSYWRPAGMVVFQCALFLHDSGLKREGTGLVIGLTNNDVASVAGVLRLTVFS